MKYLIICLLALSAFGCSTRTQFGECVGINSDRNVKYKYEMSYWNVFLGVVFSETLIVPAIVILDNLYCPEQEK